MMMRDDVAADSSDNVDNGCSDSDDVEDDDNVADDGDHHHHHHHGGSSGNGSAADDDDYDVAYICWCPACAFGDGCLEVHCLQDLLCLAVEACSPSWSPRSLSIVVRDVLAWLAC